GMQVFDAEVPAPPGRHRWTLRVPGSNCAFRRAALVAVGGFDEYFAYYHDETDISLRLVRAGYRIIHLDENAVRHYPARAKPGYNSALQRDWSVIARSDTYFALKNGADPLLVRLPRTVYLAPKKHFHQEVVRGALSRDLGLPRRAGIYLN